MLMLSIVPVRLVFPCLEGQGAYGADANGAILYKQRFHKPLFI